MLQTNRRREAEAEFREAIRVDPAIAQAHGNLGMVLRDTKRYQEAEAAFREAIRLNPAHTLARKNLDELLKANKWRQWRRKT